MTVESSSSGGVPYHLMPLAAMFGTYCLLASIKMISIVYRNMTYKKDSISVPSPTPIKSRFFAGLVLSIIVSVLAYAYIVGQVESALLEDAFANTVFDPYDILAISPSSTIAEVKKAFRAQSMIHHPDKHGDERLFLRITQAYKALTDKDAKRNYELFGHPDGKPSSPTLNFAFPDWLLHPTGKVALVLILMYLGFFVIIIVSAVRYVKQTEVKEKKEDKTNTVANFDASYLASKLNPDSSHLEVLYYIATTPENLDVTTETLKKIKQMRDEKQMVLQKAEEKAKQVHSIPVDDDDGGWASDDDDESEESKAATLALKKAEEDKKKEIQKLNTSMGKKQDISDIPLEGIDKGVIGQEWVLKRLTERNLWPPKLPKDAGTFKDKSTGKVCEPLDHPAVARNLLMTMGRLNAVMLNTHADLAKAAATGKIDQTYFKNTLELRQRSGLLLEAALRVAIAGRSYRLAKTIVETVAMFKIGVMSATSNQVIAWFQAVMEKQYGGKQGIPKLNIKGVKLETPDEKEMATGDSLMLSVDIERSHAELFTKTKIAMCQKQGIPPQLALQSYREVWWVLVRTKRLTNDGDSKSSPVSSAVKPNGLASILSDPKALKKFDDESEENILILAYPFIVSNIMKKDGTVKVKFPAPSIPGRYDVMISIMSQEFIGCNEEFKVAAANIVDIKDVKRTKVEVETKKEEIKENTEDKKEK